MLREKGFLDKGCDSEEPFFLLELALVDQFLDTVQEIAVIYRSLVLLHEEVPNVLAVRPLVYIVVLRGL